MKTVCLRSCNINRIVVPFGNEVRACVAICLLKILFELGRRKRKKLIGTCNVYDPFVRSFVSLSAHRFKCLRLRYSISFLIRCFSLRNTRFFPHHITLPAFFFKHEPNHKYENAIELRLCPRHTMRQRNNMFVHFTSLHFASPFCVLSFFHSFSLCALVFTRSS